MTKILITSALPYINGIKHLGNLAGSILPADIQARFQRQRGNEVLYICATDEHGTPAELAAAEAHLDVSAYCAKQHEIQRNIYDRLSISFDHFGRSSSLRNHALTQHFFLKLEENGFIEEREINLIYSVADGRFLPDRYVTGTCPHCGYGQARGDQCDYCTRQLDPTDLIRPRSTISGSDKLILKATKHLYLRQSLLVDELRLWVNERSQWPSLVTSIANAWLDRGLEDRCITRDLDWGVPVPRAGYEGKVFYVWFDAPIAYIATTQDWADLDPKNRDWQSWWRSDDTRYLQFLGKDNVPFHTISFPSTLLGSREPWKTVDIIKGVHWLSYQNGKFSTSQKRGVFLDHALELLPEDYWRWWLTANAPETGDTDFSFERFATDVNCDLADNLGNFVNRTISFLHSRYDGIVPELHEKGPAEYELETSVATLIAALTANHDDIALRKAADTTRAIWRLANVYLTNEAPWTSFKTDRIKADRSIYYAVNLIRISALVAGPIIPRSAAKILAALGEKSDNLIWPKPTDPLHGIPAGRWIEKLPVLFTKLDQDWIDTQVSRFSGAIAT